MRAQTTTVYRIESTRGIRAGNGPYNSEPDYDDERAAYNARLSAMGRIDSWAMTHPTPIEDGLGWLEDGDPRVCAFASMAQAREWFHSGSLEALLEECRGFYVLAAYTVPKEFVARGRRQVLFHRDAYLRREVVSSAAGLADSSSDNTDTDLRRPA